MSTRGKHFASLSLVFVLGMGWQSIDPSAAEAVSGDTQPASGSEVGDEDAPAGTPAAGTRRLTAGGLPTVPSTGAESPALAKLEEYLEPIETVPVPVVK